MMQRASWMILKEMEELAEYEKHMVTAGKKRILEYVSMIEMTRDYCAKERVRLHEELTAALEEEAASAGHNRDETGAETS